jgi:predicted enzyme related to lactoylglutathione lyase
MEEWIMAKGEMVHIEFPADDVERAKRFYGAVAGWEFGEMEGFPDYWFFRTSENAGGGLGSRGGSVSNVIRVYINVDSLETAVAAAEANGGAVIAPPSDVPGQGRYAAVTDSEGNEIGLWESAPA